MVLTIQPFDVVARRNRTFYLRAGSWLHNLAQNCLRVGELGWLPIGLKEWHINAYDSAK